MLANQPVNGISHFFAAKVRNLYGSQRERPLKVRVGVALNWQKSRILGRAEPTHDCPHGYLHVFPGRSWPLTVA